MLLIDRWFAFFNQPIANLFLRIVVMIAGIAFVAFGIALSRQSDLGLSANSSIPGVIHYSAGASLGITMFTFSLLLILMQIVLLRHAYNPLQLLSMPFLLVFSAFIDFFVSLIADIPLPNYAFRLGLSLLSCILIAIGVWLQSKVALAMLPADGAAQTLAFVFKISLGRAKIVFDLTMIVIASALSYVLMGGLYGVVEGSVLAAIFVGFFVRAIDSSMPCIQKVIPVENHITLIPRY